MNKESVLCSCIYCKEVKSSKGIFTHVDRTHLNLTKYSSGFNGKYHLDEYKTKIKKSLEERNNTQLGQLKQFVVCCYRCKSDFFVTERTSQFPKKSKYFCSASCANSHIVTDEHRQKISETLTGRQYIKPQEVESRCPCGNLFIWVKSNKKDRIYCSRKCSTTYSPKNIARRQEQRKNRTVWQNYRADCQFRFNLKDYPTEFDFRLIEQYGWYKASNRGNNLTGISRDHMVSCKYGFENNIPFEHIRHPANCKLLTHNDNSSKHKKNSITYEELLERIKIWDSKYPTK